MIITIYWICFALLVGSLLLGLVRLIRGPDNLNRIIAFDLIAICVIGIVILYSMLEESSHYIEMILVFCLLSFTTTIALMESLFRRRRGKE